MLDPKHVRKDFPIHESQPDLVYLDSAATALKPKAVINAMNEYYFEYSANVARGLYPLAEMATTKLEEARQIITRFIHAESLETIVFTANATHAINLVALGLEHYLPKGANIITTELEHHSNYLPWKELTHRTGAQFRTAHFTPSGTIDSEHLVSLVDEHTAIVAFSAVSNVFGVINPVAGLIKMIREINPSTLILIDACQAAGHISIDIQKWDADFIVFSGHKLFGPTGIGILGGKKTALALLAPMNVGGGTVLDACTPVTEYKELPANLEGGTPNIAGAIGLAKAIEYIESLGQENIREHEKVLTQYALNQLHAAFGDTLHILGSKRADERSGIISFALDGIHPHDLAHLLGEQSICVRAGEHCAAPLHRAIRLPATTRLSLSLYNTESDIDRLVEAIRKARLLFPA